LQIVLILPISVYKHVAKMLQFLETTSVCTRVYVSETYNKT
jgi:hypothetical protein